MKKGILIVLLLVAFKTTESGTYNRNAVYSIEEITVVGTKWDLLIAKIGRVESSNGIDLVGDNGKAIGYLQIHKIMVDEVNRILGSEKYSYEDRWDKEKSIDMFKVYQSHYNPEQNHEIACRIWNGGPKARFNKYKKITDKYVQKVFTC